MQSTSYLSIPLWRRDGSVRTYALISPDDRDQMAFRWNFNGLYAVRTVGGRTLYLHREIMGLVPGDGLEVDHRNRYTLDDRRCNLRVATHAQNHQNRVAMGGASKYRGVHFAAHCGRWRARVKTDGRHHHLGYFSTEEEASIAVEAFRAAHMPYSVPS